METTVSILLGTAVKHALKGTNPIHTNRAADGPSRSSGTHQRLLSFFACIDEVRALRSWRVMLSRRSALLRPAPTPARPRHHFPGSPVIGAHRFPPHRSDGAKTGLPSSQDSLPSVPCPIRRRVLRRPLLDPRRLPWPSPRTNRLGSLSSVPKGRGCDDACSGFTHVTDRTVAPAPLRTRPLDHARGHSYQGPRHLPGPDSHRPAVLNLSLDLRHDELLLLTTPKQSGRTCATPSLARAGAPSGQRTRS